MLESFRLKRKALTNCKKMISIKIALFNNKMIRKYWNKKYSKEFKR